MVILDACRNNPFKGRYRSGGGQGLSQMDAPSGSLIAYSAAPKQVALDGEGDNSPYTAALAEALVEPGLKVEEVFKRVRVAVEATTNGDQTPWESSSLRGDFYFVAKAEEPAPPEPRPKTVTDTKPSQPTTLELAARAYEAAERVHTVSGYQLVIDRFSGTFYANLAKEHLEKLKSAETQPGPPTPSAAEVEEALGLTPVQRVLYSGASRHWDSMWERRTGYSVRAPAQTSASGNLRAARRPRGIWTQERRGCCSKRVRQRRSQTTEKRGARSKGTPVRGPVRGPVHRPEHQGRGLSRQYAQRHRPSAGERWRHARSGRTVSEALSTARSIESAYSRSLALSPALSDIAQAQASAGDDIQGALSTARSIKNVSPRADALSGIARAQASAGDTRGAGRTVSEALSTARSIESAYSHADALIGIAQAQVSAGDTRGAGRTVSEALSTARSIEFDLFRAYALRDIARVQASAGDIQGALSTARSIKGVGDRAIALSGIARMQASAGDIQSALSTARSIKNVFFRADALIGIVQAYQP